MTQLARTPEIDQESQGISVGTVKTKKSLTDTRPTPRDWHLKSGKSHEGRTVS